MTTPLFNEIGGRPKIEAMLLQVSGESGGERELIHNEKIEKQVAASVPGTWNPADSKLVEEASKNRSLVLWSGTPKYAFVPGPACFGRIITLHSCWVPPGHSDPKSESDFQKMPGYEVSVFGGVGDPQFNRAWRNVPFSTSRHRVIVSNVLKISTPMKLAWFLDSADVGPQKGTGAMFFLRIDGLMEVFGSFM